MNDYNIPFPKQYPLSKKLAIKTSPLFCRRVLLTASLALLTAVFSGSLGAAEEDVEPIDIGSRLELFVDEYLIESKDGVTRELHSPQRKGPVMVFDRPWEGGTSHCVTVFDDGIRGGAPDYRMYYKASPMSTFTKRIGGAVICMAQSRDGIHWTRPKLKIYSGEFTNRYGKKYTITAPNNIVWIGQGDKVNTNDNFVPFKDKNPACKPEARYKAIARCFLPGADPSPPQPDATGYRWPPRLGLMALQSPDGIRWSFMQNERIIKKTETDAQNVAFWDGEQKQYTCYTRVWGKDGRRVRSIARLTSKDFLNWSDPPQWIQYSGVPGGVPDEQMYNDCILPYFRAPHIYLGFIMRLVGGRSWGPEDRESQVSDAVFISSRDGLHFDRSFMEGWIRPGMDPQYQSWIHGNTAPAWGLLQTLSSEMSVYWLDHHKSPDASQLQRGTLRTDGFVSVNAKYAGGRFTTKPLTFSGKELVMNFSTSAVGSVRVEIQDKDGKPLPGFAAADCPSIYGDAIDEIVKWKGGSDVSALAGQTVRLRFAMFDADLYSIRFRP